MGVRGSRWLGGVVVWFFGRYPGVVLEAWPIDFNEETAFGRGEVGFIVADNRRTESLVCCSLGTYHQLPRAETRSLPGTSTVQSLSYCI